MKKQKGNDCLAVFFFNLRARFGWDASPFRLTLKRDPEYIAQ